MSNRANILFEKIIQGDRIALGKAMTLVESGLPEDRQTAINLLEWCEQKLAEKDTSLRLTISGAPGAGKSTLIEAIGIRAISEGRKVGVLTIDPTSTISHGSILGDKSRMTRLSNSPYAFVRSSSAGEVLGGMGRRSHEMMTLLAAVGYDLILVETVGVGQSEHIAWQFTDGFILVIQPGGGDELQGIKRGITELADIVVVNKADGPLAQIARITKSQYQNALHFFSPTREGWTPKIVTCSAMEGTGIDDVWQIIRLYQESVVQHPSFTPERQKQKMSWLIWSLGQTARQLLLEHPVIREKIANALAGSGHTQVSMFRAEYEIENAMKSLMDTSNAHHSSPERL